MKSVSYAPQSCVRFNQNDYVNESVLSNLGGSWVLRQKITEIYSYNYYSNG